MKQNNPLSVQTTSAQLKALEINQKEDHDFAEMNATLAFMLLCA